MRRKCKHGHKTKAGWKNSDTNCERGGYSGRGGVIGLLGRIYGTKYKLESVVVFGKDSTLPDINTKNTMTFLIGYSFILQRRINY